MAGRDPVKGRAARASALLVCAALTFLSLAVSPISASPLKARQVPAGYTVTPACTSLPVGGVEGGGCGAGTRCRDGFCCSRTGFCGIGEPWCAAGCQLGLGDCWVTSPTTVDCANLGAVVPAGSASSSTGSSPSSSAGSSPSAANPGSTASSPATSANPGFPISTDSTCGAGIGKACPAPYCCSAQGNCGSGDPWCGTGCQVGYGVCTGASSSSSTPAAPSGSAGSGGASAGTGSTTTTPSSPGTNPDPAPNYTVDPATAAKIANMTVPPPIPKSGWSGPQIGGYFAQWSIYSRGYRVRDLQASGSASKINFINYAFGNIYKNGDNYECGIKNAMESGQGNGGDQWADYGKGFVAAESVDGTPDKWDDPLAGNFNQLRKLKLMNPNLKVLASIGGWTWSRWFSAAAATDASRKHLVKSCLDLYIRGDVPVAEGRGGKAAAYGVFDGIDIDWEFPGVKGLDYNTVSTEDRERYTALLAEFRAQLDALGQELGGRYLGLTSAISPGDDKIAATSPAQYSQYLDWLCLMTYDYHGGWDAAGPTDFNANLHPDPASPYVTNKTSGLPAKTAKYNTDDSVTALVAGGVPASKILLGVPFYGRGWTGVAAGTGPYPGLYQPATGPAPGLIEAGIQDYKILKTYNSRAVVHPVSGQSFVYDAASQTFWSYDTPEVVASKVAYAKAKGLGGMFGWAFDGDTGTGELVTEMAKFAA